MRVGEFALAVVVDGQLLDERADASADCCWVGATKGKEFSLVLVNGGINRASAVPSIDGLSVVDGQPASYRSPAYVLGARSHMLIPGWRLDNGHVARFEFAAASLAYSRRMGHSPRNVGVIAAAFFHEAPPSIC